VKIKIIFLKNLLWLCEKFCKYEDDLWSIFCVHVHCLTFNGQWIEVDFKFSNLRSLKLKIYYCYWSCDSVWLQRSETWTFSEIYGFQFWKRDVPSGRLELRFIKNQGKFYRLIITFVRCIVLQYKLMFVLLNY
jgi:hypothetical protein